MYIESLPFERVVKFATLMPIFVNKNFNKNSPLLHKSQQAISQRHPQQLPPTVLPFQTQAVGVAAAGFVVVTITVAAAVFHGGLFPLELANSADTLEKAGFGLLFLSKRHESPAPEKV